MEFSQPALVAVRFPSVILIASCAKDFAGFARTVADGFAVGSLVVGVTSGKVTSDLATGFFSRGCGIRKGYQ